MYKFYTFYLPNLWSIQFNIENYIHRHHDVTNEILLYLGTLRTTLLYIYYNKLPLPNRVILWTAVILIFLYYYKNYQLSLFYCILITSKTVKNVKLHDKFLFNVFPMEKIKSNHKKSNLSDPNSTRCFMSHYLANNLDIHIY